MPVNENVKEDSNLLDLDEIEEVKPVLKTSDEVSAHLDKVLQSLNNFWLEKHKKECAHVHINLKDAEVVTYRNGKEEVIYTSGSSLDCERWAKSRGYLTMVSDLRNLNKIKK